MISLSSIWVVVLRHLHVWRRDPNLILAGLYWPVLDILIWGFLGSMMQQPGGVAFEDYKATALLGILLWQVFARGSILTVTTIAEELCFYNVINLFSLPLLTVEWITGSLFFSFIITSFIAACCMLLIVMLYGIPLWHTLSTFIIFLPPLFFSSIWLAFTCLQIVISKGKQGVEFGFIGACFLATFSGAYYPPSVLPAWGQTLSTFLPMSYVFEGMRGYLMRGNDPTPFLIKGYIMSITYAAAAVGLFIYRFNRSRQKGLARLTD